MSKSPDEWVVVRVFAALPQAQLARGLLESEGVECYLHGEHQAGVFRLGVVEPRVMVRQEDAERAAEILADSDLAFADPDAVHLLCDFNGERPELKDLENLQIDLLGLTLCSLGEGVPRSTIEATVGALTPGDADAGIFHKPDLGATFRLDAEDRLAGFTVRLTPDPEAPDQETFPGFWDPGGSLTAPSAEELEAYFGEPAGERPAAAGRTVEWRLETATVEVTWDRAGEMQVFAVGFRG